ncbi:MAG: UrcA family protein [Oceanicaulis sp.]
MNLKSLLLPALIAAGLAGAPALAQEAETRTVEIDRAALTTDTGAALAYNQIRLAALQACRAENRGGAAFDYGVRLCVKDTLARTVDALDAPRLSALNDRREAEIRVASAG